MSRDFAKIQASSRKDKKGEKSPLLLTVAIVAIAMLCFAAGFWIGGKQAGSGSSVTVDSESAGKLAAANTALAEAERINDELQAKVGELESEVELWKNKANAGAHTKLGELEFYNELPKQSVTPAPVHESKAATPRPMDAPVTVDAERIRAEGGTVQPSAESQAPTAAEGQYRLQIASFRTRDEAATAQLKLIKGGFNGFIRHVDLGEKGSWYRVYVGPFEDKGAATKALQQVEERLKIKGLIVRGG